MDAIVDELARGLLAKLKLGESGGEERLLVGISGFPASGKSTLAREVALRVNALHGGGAEVAAVVGLDGWHFSRAHLDTMPDPALAHARRGAHWTFDGAAFVSFVQALSAEGEGEGEVRAPSFDHALKDPVPDDVVVRAAHRIVLLEGLYVFLDVAPWAAAGALLAERWFVDVAEDEAARRLVRRHVQSGITPDEESALRRAVENDLPNGRFVREHLLQPTRYITSVTDPRFGA
ncbi:P-loop containing nucleoside triphosphate hydrolase protein [Auricularia subglabra TFB-10046 SS5]|nr:P-loop containing nucleoside triphosphate hydrolase protein [Auricularia subglabra TFB-10046 SS5]